MSSITTTSLLADYDTYILRATSVNDWNFGGEGNIGIAANDPSITFAYSRSIIHIDIFLFR